MDNDMCFLFFFSLIPSGVSLILVDIFPGQLHPESRKTEKQQQKKVSDKQKKKSPINTVARDR
jgi:hypothetical protein